MAEQRILDAISRPADLKLLTDDELSILSEEIRSEILSVTSKTGGHVASSLGAVEIILAVHSLIDAPNDHFVFDVGHQAYAHKLVTGRLKGFEALRTASGVSGFPKPEESDFDTHPSGHASDSLSVALGLAEARDLRGGAEKIVALIGDASLAGGMAFEALNHIGQAQTPLVIILNDNEMSISRNVGALMKHLGNVRTSSQYRQARDTMQSRLESKGRFGKGLVSFGTNMKESIKQFFIPHSMIFEQLGIVCTAPIDGHNIKALREILKTALAADGPVLVHAVTKKGAKYAPAEKNPEVFHGIGPYDITTGLPAEKPAGPPTYTETFGQALVNEARLDEDILAVTAAMKDGTGLAPFAEEFPKRFFDVGIAEGHAVGLAAGLAAGGKKPVVAIYSTFLQRGIDQMIIDVALAGFNVVFAIDRSGIVGEDGPTHHGVFDLVYTRMIPNMRCLAPSDEAELANALHSALALGGPFAIRYPRGAAQGVALPDEPCVLPLGVSREVCSGSDVAILAFGRMVSRGKAAAQLLESQGISVRVVDMRWVKPLDEAAIEKAVQTKLVVTLEEGVLYGGVGAGVCEVMAAKNLLCPVLHLGIPDSFIHHGNTDVLLEQAGLDPESIAGRIASTLASLSAL